MIRAARTVVLNSVSEFLRAEYIRSDIDLALQSHALTEQFHNWAFDVLTNERARRRFEVEHFYSTLAHPNLTGRLQGALDILELQCVNKHLRAKCSEVLKLKKVHLYEFVNASRPVQLPTISPTFPCKLRNIKGTILKQAFRLGVMDKEQHECIRRLESLEDSFRQLRRMGQVRVQTWRKLKHHKGAIGKRMYKEEIFNWEECVDWWSSYYEISTLYEWFTELEKMS